MTPKMMLACKPCVAHLRARFKGLRTTLRRGLALIGAALLGGTATATELDYSGEVYCYEAVRDGSYKEYELNDASHRFRLRSSLSKFPSSDGTFHVAVPVTVKSGSVATPDNVAISLVGAHSGELSAVEVCGDQDFMKMVCPADPSKWNVDDEYEWEYEIGKECRSWPAKLWSDKTPIPNRYWVLAQLNGKEGNWSGLTHLRIEVRDDVNGSFSPVVVPIWRAEMIDLPGDKIFGGSSMAMKPLSKKMWTMFNDMPAGQVGIDYDVGNADKVEFQIDVKAAGTLKVVYWSNDEKLQVKGRNIDHSEDTQPNWSTRCLEVEVSAATTLTVYGSKDMCDVNIYEMSFWPSGSRCVRVAADYAERCDLDDGCGSAYLRGYVLGSGVYKSGEKATLTAVAGKTAVFVRWESYEIELDEAASTNACLSFTVPDSVCADAADRAEVQIRAVWRDRLPGEIGPAPSYAVVPGAQVSITVPDLVGYAAKGLPAGLKFDAKTGTISGAATKADTVATVTFTKKDADSYETQIVVGPLPVLMVEVNDAMGGNVTGTGAYAAGKKATLKATAAKGYVFAGWYADSGFSTPFEGEGAVDYRTPSMSCVTGMEDASVYARFVSAEDDAYISAYVCNDNYGYRLDIVDSLSENVVHYSEWMTEEGVLEFRVGVESLSLPTVKVSGLPAGLKYDAKTMMVSGKPTKSGTYLVTVTMSNASVKNIEKMFKIVVDFPALRVHCDSKKGNVTGAGAYAAGTKATLKATAAKGYVFAGWYMDESFGTPLLEAEVDYRTPSMPYVTGADDTDIYARFALAESDTNILVFVYNDVNWVDISSDFEDVLLNCDEWMLEDGTQEFRIGVESLALPTVKVSGLPAGLKYDAKTMTVSGKPTKPGIYTVKVTMSNATVKNVVNEFRIFVPNLKSAKISGLDSNPNTYRFVSGCSIDSATARIAPLAEEGYTLKFSGLPSGMKYDAKTGRVTGVPTKSGTYTVTITGTKKGEPTETATITVTVDGMPETVADTYVGHISDGDGNMSGSFTFTATAAGKLTAKVVTAQGTASFSAPSWSGVNGYWDEYSDERVFVAEMTDKAGQKLEVRIGVNGNMNESRYRDADGEAFIIEAVRNMFARKWYFAVAYQDGMSWDFNGTSSAADADLTVALKDGTATVSGQISGIKVSGSTVVRMEGDMCVRLPAFVTVDGKKCLMGINLSLSSSGPIDSFGTATLMNER